MWTGKYTGDVIEIRGEFCVPLKPDINLNPAEGMSMFEFDKSYVRSIGVTIMEYSGENDSPMSTKCKLCNKRKKTDEMRSHIGAHILSEKLIYNCGFCGGPNVNCDNRLIPSSKRGECSFIKFHQIVTIRC